MNGLVYKSTGSWYVVKVQSGEFRQARIKGVLKIDGITSTNPVAVGDIVEMEETDDGEGTMMITGIQQRNNYINRQSPRVKYQQHIVAANVDQSLLIATIKEPRTSQGFIDRFLVACEMYHVKGIVVFNKADLYKAKEMKQFEERKSMYEACGYSVYLVSAANKSGFEALEKELTNKTTLMSGHSGVGKSSIINIILPELHLKTHEISGWSGKGVHTTTFAEMFDLSQGGRIIDTPGMKEFGLIGITKPEISHYFPEMRGRLNDCHFNNCLHMNEPGCAIKKAVNDGHIPEERYISYCAIVDSMEEYKY